jgi:cytosine deaminase
VSRPAAGDLVVRAARLPGAPRLLDVAVRGDRIAAIGPDLPGRGQVEIDAAGAW